MSKQAWTLKKIIIVAIVVVPIATFELLFIARHQTPKPSPSEVAATAKEAAESQRRWDTEVGQMEMAEKGVITLRTSMRNPASLKITSAFVPADLSAACYEYRAQNGFGGMDASSAVVVFGTLAVSRGAPAFRSLWNKDCANNPGKEEAADVQSYLKDYNKDHDE